MKEIVVISGKGGTGKSSLAACFASLADEIAIADCDVDAADLHLLLEPIIKHRVPFRGGRQARIMQDDCIRCGVCEEICRFNAVRETRATGDGGMTYTVDPLSCEGCGVCVHFCPEDAIDFQEEVNGEWFISITRYGPMVHAKLGIAQENSGKLVTLVRSQAKRTAEEQGIDLLIVDGAPGIGCPVIASVTGTDLVLAVTEPTLSAEHDLKRVCQLAEGFSIPIAVCINKCDLNENISASVEDWCRKKGYPVVGRIPFDADFTRAQIQKKALTEYSNGKAAQEVRSAWQETCEILGESKVEQTLFSADTRISKEGG